ncbi:MAG: nuclease-related domain-containing protein [Akkermansiaceae bacterium]
MIKDRKLTPFTKPLLRPAGEAARLKIDELQNSGDEKLNTIVVLFMIAAVVPLLVLSPSQKVVVFILVLAVVCFQAVRLMKVIKIRDNYRLGFEGERFVAQVLQDLGRKGYYVYHDVPFEIDGRKFNIDHVVVGDNGVFAIETKAKRKPEGAVRADFDGTSLKFSDATNAHQDIKQAKGNARDLAQLLNERSGLKVFARPVLLYVGWFVKSQNDEQIIIRNPDRFITEFDDLERSDLKLSPDQVGLIRSRLAEVCALPIIEKRVS